MPRRLRKINNESRMCVVHAFILSLQKLLFLYFALFAFCLTRTSHAKTVFNSSKPLSSLFTWQPNQGPISLANEFPKQRHWQESALGHTRHSKVVLAFVVHRGGHQGPYVTIKRTRLLKNDRYCDYITLSSLGTMFTYEKINESLDKR